ncbi:MAG: VWA containing CoxE family protein, partial [Myxococcota bacterium]
MFLDLFYGLRDEGVPISIQEWQMFATALEKNLHQSDLMGFYNLAKSCLIKSETYFDAFDRVFAHIFHGVEMELSPSDELLEWLNDPKNFEGLTDEQRAALEHLDADELMKQFLERLE